MKFIIKDEDGSKYEVEEIKNETTEDEEPKAVDDTPARDDESLSFEEISALKKLAAIAPQLIELLNVENKEHSEHPELVDEDEEEDEEEDDDIFTDEDEEKEEILETKTYDSKKSVGSLESKKKSTIDDSLSDDISSTWAKRYNGGNR